MCDDLLQCLLSDALEITEVATKIFLHATDLFDFEPDFVVVIAANALYHIWIFTEVAIVDRTMVP